LRYQALEVGSAEKIGFRVGIGSKELFLCPVRNLAALACGAVVHDA